MSDYIHGFSKSECLRLIRQADAWAPSVHASWSLPDSGHLLELGCGVGAQTKHIIKNHPHWNMTAVDRNSFHLEFAKNYLKEEIESGVVELLQEEAEALSFAENTFDALVTIWLLEHVSDPVRILKEAHRVLKPGGKLILNEIDNTTLRFYPESTVINQWWSKFNTFQEKSGADPFIGGHLVDLVRQAGFVDIIEEPLDCISSIKYPDQRLSSLHYLRELLFSGAESLKGAGYIGDSDEDALRQEFQMLESKSDVDFQYTGVCVKAAALQ